MKIAILILAHKNKQHLVKLVDQLKSDFDIYIHIDKKSEMEFYECKNVVVLKKHKVYWGHSSIVDATISLLKKAHQKSYDRYVLISGQDLPTQSNREITAFFEANKNTEFIEYDAFPASRWGEIESWSRIRYFSPLRFPETYLQKVMNFFLKSIRKIQIALPITQRKDLIPFYGGDQWFNLTGACVDYILGEESSKKLLKRMKFTRCSDEIYFQTVILNSKFSTCCLNNSLRFIDWDALSENPKVLTMNNIDELKKTTSLFARKFEPTTDSDVIEEVLHLCGDKK